jgi:hypothetical protein
LEAIELARRLGVKIAAKRQKSQNSLLFSLLAGNLGVETGSILAASTTTQCIQPGGDKSRILTVAIGGQTMVEREAANR